MTTEPKKRERKARRNFQRDLEATVLFCKCAIDTCEEFKLSGAGDEQANRAMNAQIRAYRRVLQCLGVTDEQ